ncbi:MAG: transglutaminase family protein [Rhodobacteraceae bacterium]|nr:transglutaminase family protein [Paracoccaceae bacterium]
MSAQTETTRKALKKIAGQADDGIDLAEAALLLAALDHPTADLTPYREHLNSLADTVHDTANARHGDDPLGPEEMAAVLNAVMVDQFGYAGDDETYEDLDNANLMRVIERRRGLPVALGILYIFAARSQGWSAAGLNFPNHFLIRLESSDGRRVIIDPFHKGRTMGAPELRELLKMVAGPGVELEAGHYRPVSNRDVLMRLQNNVKARRLDKGEIAGAVDAVESMLVLSPETAGLWREAGVLYMRSGQLKRSVEAFEGFVSRSESGPDRDKIAKVINELRERLS